ncbi:hypothetical protein J4219_01210 [Candidatus Woesearchaeota archaeon]|nr:hypothetical protein [Candidatus Woesearchaeota archaeon]
MESYTEKLIKGRIAEVLAERLLRELGFFVLPFGKEHTAAPIIDMKSFIRACGGKFEFDKSAKDSTTAKETLDHSPDLIAVHSSGRTELIEVKYRQSGYLVEEAKTFFKLYPGAVLLVINLEMIRDFVEPKTPADKQFVANLRKTRFHIWRHDEPKIGTTADKVTNPVPLSQWLIEEFKCDTVQVEQKVKEYESYVTKWFPRTVK